MTATPAPPERWYTVRRVDEQAALAVALPAVVGLAGGARPLFGVKP